MLIELKNISKKYGSGENATIALNGINLSIDRNEFVAIMGKSGCGKTTLLNVMATILAPDSGTYYFDGEDTGSFSEKRLAMCKRRTIAVIFQDYNLVEELTLYNNIILPFVFDKREFDWDLLKEITESLGIGGLLKKYPDQISGGEKQRTAIARALLIQPKVILADEPTGNLDEESAKHVASLLRLCTDKYHCSVVMVTHDQDMASYADRIIHMHNGKTVV